MKKEKHRKGKKEEILFPSTKEFHPKLHPI
jgi:hypothetical protein